MGTSENTTKKEILDIIKDINDLPTLPTAANEVIEMINSGNTSSTDITNAISHDQSLVSKTLRIVNSAFYGFPRSITTINHAIVILGFNEIKNIILSASVFDMFSGKGSDIFDRVEFWKHCIGCATAGRMLSKSFRYRISGEVFISGILHDIGKVVLDKYLHEEFINVVSYAKEKDLLLYKAEQELLHTDHAEIGKVLLEYWKFPPHIVEVVEKHHSPEGAKINPDLASIIHFSDVLCKINQIGVSGDGTTPEIDPFVWNHLKKKKLDLNKTDIDKFSFDLNAEIEKSNCFDLLKEQ